MEQAIKKAIEGGWTGIDDAGTSAEICMCCGGIVMLDPLFWQSISKALGQGEGVRVELGNGFWTTSMWKNHWKDFTQHLIDGGNVDDFFNKLINNKDE